MIKAIKVRPNSESGRAFKVGREHGYQLPYHVRRKNTFFDSYPVNRRTLIRIWQTLHAYTSHSSPANGRKYRAAARRFDRLHMGSHRGTCRFINEYTAHAWM